MSRSGPNDDAQPELLKAQVLASLRRTREKSAHSKAAARRTQEVAAWADAQADSGAFRRATQRMSGGAGAAAPPPPPPPTEEAPPEAPLDEQAEQDDGRAA